MVLNFIRWNPSFIVNTDVLLFSLSNNNIFPFFGVVQNKNRDYKNGSEDMDMVKIDIRMGAKIRT